jgi:uncharacterized protein with PQ loop repeat
MLVALFFGFALWLAYGLLREDLIISTANAISLTLVGTLVAFKMRERGRS